VADLRFGISVLPNTADQVELFAREVAPQLRPGS
jgi:hypothetical protein